MSQKRSVASFGFHPGIACLLSVGPQDRIPNEEHMRNWYAKHGYSCDIHGNTIKYKRFRGKNFFL